MNQPKKQLDNYDGDFFLLRSPLLPVSSLTQLQDRIRGQANEIETLKKEFKLLFSSKILKEAIYLASPILYNELIKFLKNESVATDKLIISLYQYYCRMCTRCTPFGLFAGFSTGEIGSSRTSLQIFSKQKTIRYCRIDMDYLCSFTDKIISETTIDKFIYNTNSTIYIISDKLRYIEIQNQGGFKKYNIIHVDKTPLLLSVLKYAKIDRTYKDLVAYLINFGIPKKNVIDYLNDLLKAQLLVNTLNPNVTGLEYMYSLHEKLSKLPSLSKPAKLITDIINSLNEINNQSPFKIYNIIKKKLSKFQLEYDESKLFQVDLVKKNRILNLNNKIVDQVKEACAVLSKLNAGNDKNKKIAQFKKLFEERYESAWVKFTDVLDAEIGINYEEITIERSGNDNRIGLENRLNGFKLQKYLEAMKSSKFEIEVLEDELEQFYTNASLPDSIAVMTRMYKKANGETKIELRNASGPSAANLLGRFCPADQILERKVKKILAVEEKANPDKLYAEIAHIPQSRLGNILTRPHLRKFEIQFLAQTSIKTASRISIQDLYLGMISGRLVLYSKKHKKEIVPRLSSAHNYSSGSLQIYHFLCDLQSQDVQRAIYWDWGNIYDYEFLPRVIFKNVILNPAMWNLKGSKIEFLKNSSSIESWEQLIQLKNELKIPDKVIVVEGDNELFLDLTLRISLILLAKSYKKHGKLTIKEINLSDSELLVIDEKNEGYTNEIIIPLTNQVSSPHLTHEYKPELADVIIRNYSIGSEWAYFKIYTGLTTSDIIIREILKKLTVTLFKLKIIDKWFFIRYADPGYHLRIRFHLTDVKEIGNLIQMVSTEIRPLLDSGQISELKMDTYKREIERYGANLIELSEQLFWINSECVSNILRIYNFTKVFSDGEKLIVSMMAIDNLLNSFGLTEGEKLSFVSTNRNLFANEFNLKNSSILKEQVQNFYRINKKMLEDIMSSNHSDLRKDKFDQIIQVLKIEFSQTSALTKQIRLKSMSNKLNPSLLASYVHMYINRLVQSNNRLNEFLMYEYLERFYRSLHGRRKSLSKAATKD